MPIAWAATYAIALAISSRAISVSGLAFRSSEARKPVQSERIRSGGQQKALLAVPAYVLRHHRAQLGEPIADQLVRPYALTTRRPSRSTLIGPDSAMICHHQPPRTCRRADGSVVQPLQTLDG